MWKIPVGIGYHLLYHTVTKGAWSPFFLSWEYPHNRRVLHVEVLMEQNPDKIAWLLLCCHYFEQHSMLFVITDHISGRE